MNNRQIETILNSNRYTKRIFDGVYSVDKLPEFSFDKPVACVVNLDGSEKPGSHWVAVYKNSDNNSEYFDSLGQPPPDQSLMWRIHRFLGPSYRYNNTVIQHPLTTTCGQHVIYYIFHKSKGHDLQDIINSYPGGDYLEDDAFVNNFVECNFHIHPFLVDFQFLWTRINNGRSN